MLRILFALIATLPLSWAHSLGASLGRLVYRLPGRYRNRFDANIAQSALATTADELQQVKKAAVAESGKALAELPLIWSCSTATLLSLVKAADGWDSVIAAKAQGKGLIMLTPHLGCFELIGRYLAAQFPITIMFRPPKQRWLEPLMRTGRDRDHATLATADAMGVRALLRALKRGEALGILPDQAPGAGDGEWADFFGRPAYTMTLIQRLQARTGAPIVAMYAERLPGAKGYHLHFRVLPEPLASDAAVAARQLNQAMEDLIRMSPSQYLWSYNRYKIPSGAPPPPANYG